MADIQLPGANLLQSYNVAANGSMKAAAAPWAAVVDAGDDISQLGDRGAELAIKLQRVNNVKLANEMEIAMDEEYATFTQEMATNPNPDQWRDQWGKRLETLKKSHMTDQLAPEQQAVLGERYARFASKSSINIAEQATVHGIGQAKQAIGNRIEQSVRRGDSDGGIQAIQDGVSAGLWALPEAEKLTMDFEQKMEVQTVESDMQTDPLGTLDRLSQKNGDGTWANFTQLDPNQRARLQDAAKAQKREVIGLAVDDAQDGMASGAISTPEQLERRIGGVVPPRVMEQLQGELAKRWDAKEIAKRATPEYQSETVGKVSSMLDGYSAEADDYDEKFVEMDSMVRSLPEGSAAKVELSRRLNQVRTGQFREVETAADAARQNFQQAYKDQFFGETKQKQSLRTVLDDGFLTNPENLLKGGFSEDQAKQIAEAKTEKERIDLFRTLHKDRPNKSKLTPYEREAYKAIRDGKGPTTEIEWEDPDMTKKAERGLGDALTEFEKWLKANPDKANDQDAIDKKVYQIVSPQGLSKFQSSIIPPIVLPPITPAPDVPNFLDQ